MLDYFLQNTVFLYIVEVLFPDLSMLQNIFIICMVVFLLLLPFVFWMYIFVSFFPYGVSRKQFFIWAWVGAVSTLPFVYKNGIFAGNFLRDIFFHLSTLSGNIFSLRLFLSLEIFFIFMFWIVFVLFLFFSQKNKDIIIKYFMTIFFFSFLLAWGVWVIGYIDAHFIRSISWVFVLFWDLLFVSIWGIIGYYIVISFLEEGIKYIASLNFTLKQEYLISFQKYICMTACIALGFAFFENLLYVGTFLFHKWFSDWIVTLVFFRSVFAIILHLISSMLFAAWFWYILHISRAYVQHIILFFLLTMIALASHTLFDVALTFSYIWPLFFYIIAIYFFLSYINTTTS